MNKATLVEKEKLSDEIFRLRLELKDKIDFVPGQYFVVSAQNELGKISRAYSISSDKSMMPRFDFTIRRRETNGLSQIMTDLEIGAEVELNGPYGVFTKDLSNTQKVVLIAIGCGIAPLKSMLEYWIGNNEQKEIWLFYGNRNIDQIPYDNLWKKLDKENKIKYIGCISRLEKEFDNYQEGRVNEVLKEYANQLNDAEFFISGSLPMVADTQYALSEMGIDKEKIFFEKMMI